MPKRKRLMTLFGILFVLGAFTFQSSAQAPVGTLRNVDGGSVAIGDLTGRVVLLAFGGALDPQSPDQLPILERMAARYASKGVDVYWVSVDPDRQGAGGALTDEQLKQYAASNGYRGKILRDPAGDVLRSIGTGRKPQLPTFVVLDAGGAVVGRPIAGFDPESDLGAQLAGLVDTALRGGR